MSKDLTSEFAKYHQPVEQKATTVEAAVEDPKPIRAKLSFDAVGVCPYCSKVMKKTICCDQTMFLCDDDRFVSPLPNEDLDGLGGLV